MSESTLFEHWSRGNDLLFTDFRFDSFALNRAENGFHPALSAHLTTHSMAIYDFQLVEGRLWNDSIDEAFTKNSFKVIINETAKRVYGIKDITKDKLQPEEPHYASSSLPDFYNPPCEIDRGHKGFQCSAPFTIHPTGCHLLSRCKHRRNLYCYSLV